MLASPHKKLELRFPLIASPKLDGIRAWVPPEHDSILSRKLKVFPNTGIYQIYEDLAILGLDGEFCVGPTTAHDLMRRTNSAVMSFDGDLSELVWWIFDDCSNPEDDAETRLSSARARVEALNHPQIKFVPQTMVFSLDELLELESAWLELGFEGAMVRSPTSPYKFGRSTEKEGFLLKIKRFVDSEAIILGVEELMHNTNEAQISETGHTKRSTKKEGKIGGGVLGAVLVRDIYDNREFTVGTGFDGPMREELWKIRDTLPGMTIKYKHFAIGAKDKPRFPTFLGFRNVEID